MKRLTRRGKKKLVNLFLSVITVCFSPYVGNMAAENAGKLTYSLSGVVSGIEGYTNKEEKAPVLTLNPLYQDVYKPELTFEDNLYAEMEGVYFKEKDDYSDLIGMEYGKEKQINDEESTAVMSFNMAGFSDDLSVYSGTDGKIIKETYSKIDGKNYINLEKGGQVRNATDLPADLVKKTTETLPDIKIELSDSPEVLIMHTHTGESYQLPGSTYYDSEYSNRSNDPSQNVVAVGAEIAATLAENGISVIHDGTIHDFPEYNGSYNRSAVTVKELLQMYPSIKIVLDIHRDAIIEMGSPVSAVATINGKQAAQVMIISAADDGSYNIPDYLENLKLASYLQGYMESDNNGLTRPVLFQYCHYNQDLSTGSLLIEIGSHGNSIDEALYTGQLIGESIAKALLDLN